MHRLEPGSVVQGLRVEREIGRGAFGTVYLAEDELLGRRVALKVVGTPDPTMRDRGLREARVVARVKSPCIVTLYRAHALDADEGWLLEMEYVGGGSLKDLLARDERLPMPRTVEILRGVLEALRAAHEAGVVHGDVKPGNVLLEPTGAVKLADFGLSWLLGDATLSSVGADGPVGTPAYMAPEVILGRRCEAASDLWSTGVMLYQMIAGRMPFRMRHLQQLFLSVVNAEPSPLPDSVPPHLQSLVARLLEKDPAARPTATEAVAMLDAETAAREPEPDTGALPAGPVLLGREAETGMLAELLARLAGGDGAALLVTGDAGAGKSALLQWLLAQAQARGTRALEVTVSALEGALRPLLRAARRIAPAEIQVPGIAEEAARQLLHGEGDADFANRQQIAWMVVQIFEALAADGPLVVAVENAQEADVEDVRMLRELMRQLPGKGVLMAVAFRTHDVESSASGAAAGNLHELAALPGLRTLEAGPLAHDAILALLEQVTHASHIESSVAQRLVALSEGNPLLATEMMRHFEAMGSVVADGSSIRSTNSWEATSLPARFHEIVERRVAGLPEDHRAVLDAAAVDGRDFDGEALEAILGRSLLDILRDLQRLYRERHLVEPHGEGFRFTSPVVQEVLYDGIAPALRRALHRRLAEHLEQRTQPVDPERLGGHWERAGDRARAVPHLMTAAAAAGRRQEKLRLLGLCRRAGMEPGWLTPEAVRDHLDVLLRAAAALGELGRTEEMEQLYDDLLANARDLDILRVQVRRGTARYYTRGVKSVDGAMLRQAVDTLPVSKESGHAHLLLGLVAKVEGRLAEADSEFRAAADQFRAIGDTGARLPALNQIASVALRSEHFEEAEDLYGAAAALARETGRPLHAAVADINRALAAMEGGRVEGLDKDIERALRTLMMVGTGPVPGATTIHARILYAQGRLSEAFARIETAVDLLRQYTDVVSAETVRSEEAHLAAVLGLLPRARESLALAEDAARKGGHRLGLVSLACLGTQIHCMAGDRDAARKAAARALELASGAEEASTRSEPDLWLAESVLYGLPADCLPSSASPWVQGAQAYADPDARLEPPDKLPGARRATLRIVRDLWAAEARRRRGEGDEAAEDARRAAEDARALGHAWLQLTALRMLRDWTGGAATEERDRVLERILDRLPEGAERDRVAAAWA